MTSSVTHMRWSFWGRHDEITAFIKCCLNIQDLLLACCVLSSISKSIIFGVDLTEVIWELHTFWPGENCHYKYLCWIHISLRLRRCWIHIIFGDDLTEMIWELHTLGAGENCHYKYLCWIHISLRLRSFTIVYEVKYLSIWSYLRVL